MNVHGHKRVAGTCYDQWEGGFKGATNDKTIVRSGKMINAIVINDLFMKLPFKVYINENFEIMELRGVRAIDDGGYHRWVHTIA